MYCIIQLDCIILFLGRINFWRISKFWNNQLWICSTLLNLFILLNWKLKFSNLAMFHIRLRKGEKKVYGNFFQFKLSRNVYYNFYKELPFKLPSYIFLKIFNEDKNIFINILFIPSTTYILEELKRKKNHVKKLK